MEIQAKESSKQTMYIMIGLGLIIYIGLSVLAGMPAAANLTAFVIGLAVLFLILLVLAAFTWYLLFKPLPAAYKVETISPMPHTMRQGIALFLVITNLLGLLGGLWDVAWHTTYGLPFGPDFFWRPHQFIYLALFSPIAVAALIWFQTLRNGKGTLQQRFRADVPLSIVMLGGIYMLAIVPMDPVWHSIYAEDITGLSVPHLLFSLPNTVLSIGFLSIWLSYKPLRASWQGVWQANKIDLLISLTGATTLITILIVAAGDWEMVMSNRGSLPRLPMLIASRPDWALIATLSFSVVWVASIVSRSTKLYGAATLSVVIAAIIRQSLFAILNNGFDGKGTWLVLLPFAVTVDLLAWYGAKRGQAIPTWLSAILLTVMGAILALPQINVFYTSPTVTLANAPIMILAIFFATYAASWTGRVIGDYIASAKQQTVQTGEAPKILPVVLRFGALIGLMLLLFAIWFISSSSAPIL